MIPRRITYGERYEDNSGWKRFLSIDVDDGQAMVELSGSDHHIVLEDLEWLVRAYMQARDKLGFDKLIFEEATPHNGREQQP
jgi:hypothetical protein